MNRSSTIALIIIVIALAVGFFYARKHNSGSPSTTGNTSQNSSPYGANSPAAGLNTQGVFGSSSSNANSGILLRDITMPQAGFVVIQADNNGQPGQVFGYSQLLSQGQNSTVPIPTDTTLIPQTTYFVSLYGDTNNNGKFDEGVDQIMTSQSGQKIQQTFTAPSQSTSSPSGSGRQ